MSKLLLGKRTFDSVQDAWECEQHFQRILEQYADRIYPGYWYAKFSVDVQSEEDVRRADYALVSKVYSDWWVVEVELSHHALYGHVIPQVRSLSNGYYSRLHAEVLADALPQASMASLVRLVERHAPRVLVVVNAQVPAWMDSLHALRAEVGIFEAFRSDNNEYAYRMNGFRPSSAHTHCGSLTLVKLNPAVLRSPNPIQSLAGRESVAVAFGGRTREWQVVNRSGETFLIGGDVIASNLGDRVDLVQGENGDFLFT